MEPHYSGGHTNRGGRSNRGSAVIHYSKLLDSKFINQIITLNTSLSNRSIGLLSKISAWYFESRVFGTEVSPALEQSAVFLPPDHLQIHRGSPMQEFSAEAVVSRGKSIKVTNNIFDPLFVGSDVNGFMASWVCIVVWIFPPPDDSCGFCGPNWNEKKKLLVEIVDSVSGTLNHSLLFQQYLRVKTIEERLNCQKKFVYFEIGAVFHSLYRRVKKRANFKINEFLQAIQSFLYCRNSNKAE